MTEDPRYDGEVVTRILGGETHLFGILVEKYERLMFSFLLPQVRSLQEVEDIAQDAFLKAFCHLGSFDRTRRFSAWLLKIAKNLVVDRYRKNQPVTVSDTLLNDVLLRKSSDFPGKDPEKQVQSQEEFRRTFLDMLQLPEDLRVPLLLRVLQELSYEEIADILEVPVQTVKNRIFKARKAMREKRKTADAM